jgi:ligand-binding sensor domain-containing protein
MLQRWRWTSKGLSGSEHGGLALLDKEGHWRTYTRSSTKGALHDDRIRTLALGPDGSLWVGDFTDVLSLGRDGRWQDYSTDANPDLNLVETMATGPDGSLWIGSGAGLAWLNKNKHRWYTTGNDGDLPDNNVVALAVDNADGSLWGATNRDKRGGLTLDKSNPGRTTRPLAPMVSCRAAGFQR